MINSALEQAIDVATTSFDPLAKLAKDIAAGAVLIATVNAVAVGYLVFSGRVAHGSSRCSTGCATRPRELTLIALVVTIIVVIASEGVHGARHAAARRASVGPCGGRVRRLDGRDADRRSDEHRFLISSLCSSWRCSWRRPGSNPASTRRSRSTYGGVLGALVTLVVFQVFT